EVAAGADGIAELVHDRRREGRGVARLDGQRLGSQGDGVRPSGLRVPLEGDAERLDGLVGSVVLLGGKGDVGLCLLRAGLGAELPPGPGIALRIRLGEELGYDRPGRTRSPAAP